MFIVTLPWRVFSLFFLFYFIFYFLRGPFWIIAAQQHGHLTTPNVVIKVRKDAARCLTAHLLSFILYYCYDICAGREVENERKLLAACVSGNTRIRGPFAAQGETSDNFAPGPLAPRPGLLFFL